MPHFYSCMEGVQTRATKYILGVYSSDYKSQNIFIVHTLFLTNLWNFNSAKISLMCAVWMISNT